LAGKSRMDAPGQRIAEKLAARILPGYMVPVTTWEGFGIGLHCDGCDLPVLPSESQVETTMPDGRTIRFHAPCAAVWRRLKEVLILLRR
jgi:hypothetical protein